jgi:hypothetical protein
LAPFPAIYREVPAACFKVLIGFNKDRIEQALTDIGLG